MIEGHFTIGTKGLEETGFLRSMVFTEGQGVDPSIERDMYDHFAHHLVVKDGHEVVATGRLIYKNDEFLIGRIAVDEQMRGQKLGDLVVRMLCERAFNLGAKEVVVHSQTQVKDFYGKVGFLTVGGVYQEADIDHVTMILKKEAFGHPCESCGGC